MHSTCSDGSMQVAELVAAVRDAGVAVFALTDHDTVAGLAEAKRLADAYGLRLLPGVELSTRLENLELHILGYGFDPEHTGLVQHLQEQREARQNRIPALVERLRSLGVAISVEDVYEVAGSANPGRPHVAKAMVQKGFARDVDDAFRRFLGDSAPANVRKQVPSPEEAIRWIHEAGGKAVWAHPLARNLQRPGGIDRLARELRDQGLDGLEEVHPAHDANSRRRIRKTARELGMRLTGGSDFHGEATPGVMIGRGRGRDEVPVSVVDALFE
ncbi:MAG: PHP domain-containing protein [Myxococcales bacterium]